MWFLNSCLLTIQKLSYTFFCRYIQFRMIRTNPVNLEKNCRLIFLEIGFSIHRNIGVDSTNGVSKLINHRLLVTVEKLLCASAWSHKSISTNFITAASSI